MITHKSHSIGLWQMITMKLKKLAKESARRRRRITDEER